MGFYDTINDVKNLKPKIYVFIVLTYYMTYADLHSHTTVSDGETKPDEVIDLAIESDLNAVAITDHDRVNPFLNEPLEIIDGIDVLNGIELRVKPEDINDRIDLLGYGVKQTTDLENLTGYIQEDRIERAERMIDLIEDETGVLLDFKPKHNTGRPHIARAIDNSNKLDYTYEQAFEELIGKKCPCYTSRNIPNFQTGLSVLKQSCEFISLAHPYRYDNPREVLKLAKQLDGVECRYPYFSKGIPPVTGTNLAYVAVEWFDLTLTGGSDSHEPETLGTKGLSKDQYKDFLNNSNLRDYSQI